MNRTRIIILLFSLLISHLTLASDENIADLSLEDLLKTKVFTSSKQTEEITVAPGVISLITQRQIEAYGADNLLQLLERVSSAYGLGSYLFPQNVLSLRGDLASHFNNHVLLLVDGRPIRESLTGGIDIAVYLSFPMNTISHIEVVRGPGSVLYGTNAFAGVVNIVTLDLRNEQSELTIGAGEFNGKSLSVLKQNDLDGHHLTFGLQYLKDDGWPFQTLDEIGQSVDESYAQENLGTNFKWHFHEWQISGFYGRSEQANLGAIPIISLGAPNKTVDTSRGFVDLQYEKQFSDNWFASYNLTYNQFSEMIDVAGAPFDGKSNDWLLETNQRFNLSPEWQLLTGASIYNQSGRAIQAGNYAVPKYNETWYRAFAEFTWLTTDQNRLVLGTQANKPHGIDWEFVSRASFIYNFQPNWGAKVLYGEAFRSAFEIENALNAPGVLTGNPDLTPEKVATTDLQVFYHQAGASFSITYFHSKQTDTITRTPIPNSSASTYINAGELEFSGLELEFNYHFNQHLNIEGSVSRQENRLNNLLDDTTLVPQDNAKLGLIWHPLENWRLGFHTNYFSAAPEWSAATTQNPKAAAFAYSTLKLNYRINESTELNLYADNLFDEEIYYPEFSRRRINTLPGRAGRHWWAYLSMKF